MNLYEYHLLAVKLSLAAQKNKKFLLLVAILLSWNT